MSVDHAAIGLQRKARREVIAVAMATMSSVFSMNNKQEVKVQTWGRQARRQSQRYRLYPKPPRQKGNI